MQTFKIGRDYNDPIQISDRSESVSHDHATITIDDNGNWTLIDNNSTNGTYIEDRHGHFVRCSRVSIKPSTWIRLGDKGERGYYMKARRVISPNDYYDDFLEVDEINKAYEQASERLEEKRRMAKFITPALMVAGLLVSFAPGISGNGLAVRASFMLPGFLSPFIQDMLIVGLDRKVKQLRKQRICPKCRKPLSDHEIDRRTCTSCHIS